MGPKENCGIFGIFGHPDAARLTYLGLYALQHRGEESAGIVTSDGKEMKTHRGMGHVADIFTPEALDNLKGALAIGHVRYSTTGASIIENAQPFFARLSTGHIGIAHNGNLTNSRKLRRRLEKAGSIFQSTMDTEIIIHLITKSRKKGFEERLVDALSKVRGAYSLVLTTANELIGIRDPRGFRPLCLGKVDGAYCLASETCALDLIHAQFIREIEPGEIVFINKDGLHSIKPFKKVPHTFCIFEFIYFARPDSNIFGDNVYRVRVKLGRQLAIESPAKSDVVMPIPDSGNYAALGFSRESQLPFEMGIVRNHYVGRTFIQPSPYVRDIGVRVKLNPVRDIVKGKRITVIEDSIVRGTTSKTRIRTLREAGAKEIHMRVSCPPHRYPCVYGIDFPTKNELIASKKSIEGIRKSIGLDSLAYLSLKGLLGCMPSGKFCTACFDGSYPEAIPDGNLSEK